MDWQRGCAHAGQPRRLSLRERLNFAVLLKKSFSVGGVAEGFGAARAGGGECSGQVAGVEAAWQIGAADVLMKESGVEAVACADGVDRVHLVRGTDEALVSSLRQRSLAA